MRFDAYCGSIAGGDVEQVAGMISWSLKARMERGRPRGRHHDVFEVYDGAALSGWVGRDATLDSVYFEFKGATTPDAVQAIRKHWGQGGHRVSRGDSAEDYAEPGAFESVVAVVDGACDPRVQADMIAPRNGDRGRTFYWGATSSAVRVRVYEAGKMKDRLHFNRPDWVRAEAQVRPAKSIDKLAASFMSPVELWGFSAWTRKAAEVLTQVEVPRYAPAHTPPTFDGTTLYLARAYRRHLQEMLADLGDWECIGRELAAVWAADDEAEALKGKRAEGVGPA